MDFDDFIGWFCFSIFIAVICILINIFLTDNNQSLSVDDIIKSGNPDILTEDGAKIWEPYNSEISYLHATRYILPKNATLGYFEITKFLEMSPKKRTKIYYKIKEANPKYDVEIVERSKLYLTIVIKPK